MLKDVFHKYYGNLNPAQKKAVDTIEGPVMVVAGPGTGKTRTLTRWIAQRVVSDGVDPASIMAVTFTHRAAAEMARRLSESIGARSAKTRIGTFHSICFSMLKEKKPDLATVYDAGGRAEILKFLFPELAKRERDGLAASLPEATFSSNWPDKPCSGLKMARTLTPGALSSIWRVERPEASMPV